MNKIPNINNQAGAPLSKNNSKQVISFGSSR